MLAGETTAATAIRRCRLQTENVDETRCALAMIENQDANVGRVLSKLDELGLAANTIVLYFSDNGPNSWRWNGGMKGRKGTTDDGGVRSTCFLRWPARLPADHRVTQIAGAIDLLPTLTAMAGVTRIGDKPLDGRDLSSLLFKQPVDWPDRMIFSTWAGKVSVRTQRHRLDDQGRLFDMHADPGQASPINERDPETAARLIAARLIAAVKTWRQEMFGNADNAIANIKGQVKAVAGNSVDPRPIPVGYREFPITMLPARDGESSMKDFRPLKLGEMTLEKGQAPLTLRALDIPGQSVMDVRRITLTLLP